MDKNFICSLACSISLYNIYVDFLIHWSFRPQRRKVVFFLNCPWICKFFDGCYSLLHDQVHGAFLLFGQSGSSIMLHIPRVSSYSWARPLIVLHWICWRFQVDHLCIIKKELWSNRYRIVSVSFKVTAYKNLNTNLWFYFKYSLLQRKGVVVYVHFITWRFCKFLKASSIVLSTAESSRNMKSSYSNDSTLDVVTSTKMR